MALLSTLVKALAESEGLEEAYVSGVARYLREGGLITQAGRGRGAAKMSARDAANLLIGINASPTAKQSVETVRLFSNLVAVSDAAFPNEKDWDEAMEGDEPVNAALRKGTRLGSALETIVSLYVPDERGYFVGLSQVALKFVRPKFECFIALYDDSDPDEPEGYAFTRFAPPNEDRSKSENLPDRIDTTEVSDRTLSVVGKILAS